MRKLTLSLTIAAAATLPVAAGATAPGTNGQIAFRRFFDAGHQTGALFLINPDGTGERQVTHPPAGEIDAQYGPPAFAPDGSKLVFTRSGRGHDSLWTVDVGTGAERRLTPVGKNEFGQGTYAPSGRLIAFTEAEGPLKNHNLRVSLKVMAADGTHARTLVDLGYNGDLGRVAWSPDGKRLVYEAVRFGSKSVGHALFVVSVRGGRPQRIGPWRKAEVNTLDWSPDGARLLVQFLPLNSNFGGDYYTIRPDGSGLHRLTHFGPKATTGSAGWSPDGRSIVFANSGVGGNDDIYVMGADGGSVTPVTQTPSWESAAAWGPAR
jgi:Tol biopolymer transport system component